MEIASDVPMLECIIHSLLTLPPTDAGIKPLEPLLQVTILDYAEKKPNCELPPPFPHNLDTFKKMLTGYDSYLKELKTNASDPLYDALQAALQNNVSDFDRILKRVDSSLPDNIFTVACMAARLMAVHPLKFLPYKHEMDKLPAHLTKFKELFLIYDQWFDKLIDVVRDNFEEHMDVVGIIGFAQGVNSTREIFRAPNPPGTA